VPFFCRSLLIKKHNKKQLNRLATHSHAPVPFPPPAAHAGYVCSRINSTNSSHAATTRAAGNKMAPPGSATLSHPNHPEPPWATLKKKKQQGDATSIGACPFLQRSVVFFSLLLFLVASARGTKSTFHFDE